MTDLPAPKQRKAQIRPALAEAIVLMVEGGKTLSEAADAAGLREESLRKALAKPHVKAHVSDVARAWRRGETFQSWHTVSALRKNAESEDVRLKAARTFIGAAGELEPERDHGHAVGLAIQIVIPEAYGASHNLQATAGGVVEAPAFDPRSFATRVIQHDQAEALAID